MSADALAAPAPLVSVITIFYQAERFFEAAIESVLAQTDDRWELLLVDDGSTDGSTAIARRYAASHPDRIRYLEHPGHANRGMSQTRNRGIAAARGRYIAFVDADDVYLPQKLERQIAILEAHPEAAMVYGPTLHWYSWSGRPDDATRDTPRRLGVEPDSLVEAPELARAFLARRADTPATCAALIRREAIEAVGGFESGFPGLFEDQAFFFKVCLARAVWVERQAWDRYRRHPDALCEVKIRAGEHADDYRPTVPRGQFLRWLESYLDRNAITDPAVRRDLRRELWPYRHPTIARLVGGARRLARAVVPAGIRRHLGRVSNAAARWA
jgi:glycosyltransferase involved in cell wall biosynthesis